MKTFNQTVLTLLIGLCCCVQGLAASNQPLIWEDLVPAEIQLKDPTASLNGDQFFLFTEILYIREQLDAGEEFDETTMETYKQGIEELKRQDVDFDTMVSTMNLISAKRNDNTLMVNTELDGKNVSIPGYMLPLEFDGFDVSEFLLVPYVGACVHTPPPPANQIVHVKAADGITFRGGYFSPVRVNGLMQIKGNALKTKLIDGSSLIYSSYLISADSVDSF